MDTATRLKVVRVIKSAKHIDSAMVNKMAKPVQTTKKTPPLQ